MDKKVLLVLWVFMKVVCTFSQDSCPPIVSRKAWAARTPFQIDYALIPIRYAIIHHTATPACSTRDECILRLQSIQNYHMDNLDFYDIGYNFIIGGDGRIYEGAGWHKIGAHTFGYNSRSLGIAFIGNFQEILPGTNQLDAAKKLLKCAVERGELHRTYNLLGAKQVSATESPGRKLYEEIRTWDHYQADPKD